MVIPLMACIIKKNWTEGFKIEDFKFTYAFKRETKEKFG